MRYGPPRGPFLVYSRRPRPRTPLLPAGIGSTLRSIPVPSAQILQPGKLSLSSKPRIWSRDATAISLKNRLAFQTMRSGRTSTIPSTSTLPHAGVTFNLTMYAMRKFSNIEHWRTSVSGAPLRWTWCLVLRVGTQFRRRAFVILAA